MPYVEKVEKKVLGIDNNIAPSVFGTRKKSSLY